jgi:hypothetical protein
MPSRRDAVTPAVRRGKRAAPRCEHGHGSRLCFECFRAGSERTKARQEAWAQRALPFEDLERTRGLSERDVAHRKRMLAYLERASGSRQ